MKKNSLNSKFLMNLNEKNFNLIEKFLDSFLIKIKSNLIENKIRIESKWNQKKKIE